MKIKDRIVKNVKLADLKPEPISQIKDVAMQINAEGSVLLENDGMLPFKKGDKVSVFGRMQKDYYNSGTGSGGLVNIPYKTHILDGLKELGDVEINTTLEKVYDEWVAENPHDFGNGWQQPWYQREMPLTDEILNQAKAFSNKAVYILARTAGEDQDNSSDEGSYKISSEEAVILKQLRDNFAEVCVVLNVGNVIDMKWVKDYNINSVLYVWSGGQDGGRAVAEILCGKRYPSGKLSDTIVKNIEKYPAYEDYTHPTQMVYREDIFVGYRYFETFDKENVMYPFGYGKGYTDFEINTVDAKNTNNKISVAVNVKNIGNYPGKEVIQVYFEAVGKNRPSRELISFAKTKELVPGEAQIIECEFDIYDMKSYDEENSQYILDKGDYKIYVGSDVRSAQPVYVYTNPETKVTEKCNRLFSASSAFERIKNENGRVSYEQVKPYTNAFEDEHIDELAYTGDKGIKLADVYYNKASIQDFIAQLSDFDLACITQGEGMNSAKVRPGTGGAIGGVTKSLQDFGIPAISVTDGPSGIRMDNGDKATSLPNGTMLSCTWNEEIVRDLYVYEGMELYAYKIDALLGPGINIHRMPLCGRNFEYFAEDPYLAGVMTCAICDGLSRSGVSGTIKHFAANSREQNRHIVNSLVSERALREIYLKPFEMAIKDKKVKMLMTAYNRVNNHSCSAYWDLSTGILRNEWNFDGLVMSDWWANSNVDENDTGMKDRDVVIMSQNDVYMVNQDAEKTAEDIMSALENNKLTRAHMQRCAMNICNVILTTPTFERFLDGDIINADVDISKMTLVKTFEDVKNGAEYEYPNNKNTQCALKITYSSNQPEIVQMNVKVKILDKSAGVFAINGTEGAERSNVIGLYLMKDDNKFVFDFNEDNICVKNIELYAE